MANDIFNDPRFRHALTDPRFKTIPRRSRKVRIGSRFQSMFTDRKFKVNYGVDKRGRRVQQSSSDDLRRYYHLHDDGGGKAMTSCDVGKPPRPVSKKQVKMKKQSVVASGDKSDREDATEENSGEGHTHFEENSREDHIPSNEMMSSDEWSGSDAESDSSTDIEDVMALRDPEVVHAWWEDEVSPSHSIVTGSRLSLCRMDWDHINATDILVFLASFKPQGGSINKVSVIPSDFGIERMTSEDVAGPAELIDQSDSSACDEASREGRGYSNERLRQYQFQRLNYYYAVVECDSKETAEHVYEQCDGLQFEQCGGRLDLRFVPDDMTFDDREPKSVATETSVPVGYSPPEFVMSALQQSKVQLTWDETDPQRLQNTMRKFSRDDMLKMDFDAYLASSGDDSGNECGTPGERGGEPKANHSSTKHSNKLSKYRSLLVGGDNGEMGEGVRGGEEEVLEISWEPGLREGVREMVKRQGEREEGEETTWEQYRRERKKKTKTKRSETKGSHGDGKGGEGPQVNNLRFNDPFFKEEGGAMATTRKTSNKKNHSKAELSIEEKQEKSELELLVMEGEGEEEERRAHFSLDSILQQDKLAGKKTPRKRRKRMETQVVNEDSFRVDVNDERFRALYSNHQYAPDPAHPQYRATKAMFAIMEERRKRREMGGAILNETTPTSDGDNNRTFSDPSVAALVKAVQSKTQALNQRRQRSKVKRK